MAARGEPAGVRATPTLADYYEALAANKLVDIDSGSRDTLIADLRRAEALLRAESYQEAAVALYAIVESPRYEGFEDFIEYQNSLYYLGVALAEGGASDAAVDYLLRALEAGPSSLYFAPAHRRIVDIALETRRPKEMLARLEGLKLSEALPPSLAGERAYLKARVAYDAQDFAAAEAQLVTISQKSRLYSSALYLRGVIRTRRGELEDAAASFCEIASQADNDRYSFVVDERYFRIKDLARLGLARLAHESNNYDNAYYHYFQIPEDSDKLGDALFEAAWSMYQKHELATARDLVTRFLKVFPDSPMVPEAQLLAGYIELADCKFTEAQAHYDTLVKELEPIVREVDAIRKEPRRRGELFERALTRWRLERAVPDERLATRLETPTDRVVALLRVDPEFVELHESLRGLQRAAGAAPHVVKTWQDLSAQMGRTAVQGNSEQEFRSDSKEASMLVEDLEQLRDELVRRQQALRAAKRSGALDAGDADEEEARLKTLAGEIDALQSRARKTGAAAAESESESTPPSLRPLVQADRANSRELEEQSRGLVRRLDSKAKKMAQGSLDGLYEDLRRVLDKAKLGKIDAVIGQKRRLEIEVQDLASGRFPAELHGQLWEQGLIGDDEEFWPYQGEYWADEYEGWR